MAVTEEIAWGDGSGDKIYLTADALEGNQTILVSSDANAGAARTKDITITAGSLTQTLTVNQAANLPSYVSDGLVLWLDGIAKGSTTSWVDLVSGYSFTNYGATFNADHVYFDGTDDYLKNTTFSPPLSGTGTIEVVIENENFGLVQGIVFAGKTNGGLAFGMLVAKTILWSIGKNARAKPVATLAKASFSLNTSRLYQNGVSMSTSGTDYYGSRDSNNYIGRRSSGNYFKGKVYSIRIYNRQITQQEALANLAIDNERFNLGLTL